MDMLPSAAAELPTQLLSAMHFLGPYVWVRDAWGLCRLQMHMSVLATPGAVGSLLQLLHYQTKSTISENKYRRLGRIIREED